MILKCQLIVEPSKLNVVNKSYLSLLCLVPLLNIVWVFVCRIKGNEWALKNGNYSNPREFLLVQDTWNRAGFVAFIIALIFIVIYVIFFAVLISAFSNLRL